MIWPGRPNHDIEGWDLFSKNSGSREVLVQKDYRTDRELLTLCAPHSFFLWQCAFQIQLWIAYERICTLSEIFLNAAYCSSALDGWKYLSYEEGRGNGKQTQKLYVLVHPGPGSRFLVQSDSLFRMERCLASIFIPMHSTLAIRFEDSGRSPQPSPLEARRTTRKMCRSIHEESGARPRKKGPIL
jgi:hypothetical protein